MFRSTSSLVFKSARSDHMLNQWRQYYHCRGNFYCCFIKQDIQEKTIVIVLDFRNAKRQMESMGAVQPVSSKRFIAVFQIMQKSEFRDKYIFTRSK